MSSCSGSDALLARALAQALGRGFDGVSLCIHFGRHFQQHLRQSNILSGPRHLAGPIRSISEVGSVQPFLLFCTQNRDDSASMVITYGRSRGFLGRVVHDSYQRPEVFTRVETNGPLVWY